MTITIIPPFLFRRMTIVPAVSKSSSYFPVPGMVGQAKV